MDVLHPRREAAKRLGYAPKTLANWASAGKGPRITYIGRLAQYKESDLERFIQEEGKTRCQ